MLRVRPLPGHAPAREGLDLDHAARTSALSKWVLLLAIELRGAVSRHPRCNDDLSYPALSKLFRAQKCGNVKDRMIALSIP